MTTSNHWKLELALVGGSSPVLRTSSFTCPFLEERVDHFIGVSSSRLRRAVPWTVTTAAIVAFAIQAKLVRTEMKPLTPLFEGGAGSIAKSLEWILNKQRAAQEIFGYSGSGRPLFNRFIKILNFKKAPYLPRLVFLEDTAFPTPDSIAITLDGKSVDDEFTLKRLRDHFVELVEQRTEPKKKKYLSLQAA